MGEAMASWETMRQAKASSGRMRRIWASSGAGWSPPPTTMATSEGAREGKAAKRRSRSGGRMALSGVGRVSSGTAMATLGGAALPARGGAPRGASRPARSAPRTSWITGASRVRITVTGASSGSSNVL